LLSRSIWWSLKRKSTIRKASRRPIPTFETLSKFEFDWVQGSLYVSNNEDLAKLFSAIMALRNLPWFPSAVRDIRAFRVEQWSDFTQLVKGAPSNTGS